MATFLIQTECQIAPSNKQDFFKNHVVMGTTLTYKTSAKYED